MKLLLAVLVALFGAVLLALLLLRDPGYVLIAYDVWTVETSLSFFVVTVLLGYLVLYLLGRSLRGIWRMPGRVRSWRRRQRRERARLAFDRGMLALSEGHWKKAERRLLRQVRGADVPMLNYLGAARAAQHMGETERRDRYLHLAHETAPSTDLAVSLTQAELQIANHQLEQALATLTHLRSAEPNNTYVLGLLVRLYRELRDWPHLRDLLPDLRRQQVLPREDVAELEHKVHTELLNQAAARHDLQGLRDAWSQVPKPLQDQEDLLSVYVRNLIELGRSAEAEPLLRTVLRSRWSDGLVYLYGLVQGEDPTKQLAVAEQWAKEHGKSPVLLLTLGRLSLRNRLWGKARIYLESSIGAGPRPETYKELGALLERMGDHDAAMSCYREGMALAVSESTYRFPDDADVRAETAAVAKA